MHDSRRLRDHLCLIQPWGSDVTEIRVPTHVIYGLTDVLVRECRGASLDGRFPAGLDESRIGASAAVIRARSGTAETHRRPPEVGFWRRQ
jgi:hypothetical protein